MTAPDHVVDPVLGEALAAFGVDPVSVHAITGGGVNQHWRITSREGDLVLRRYTAFRLSGAIDVEHGVLRDVRAMEWPVAAPMAAPGGRTVVEVAGARFALFPFLPGEVRLETTPAHQGIKGRLLARLHRDLARLSSEGQRPGFGRAWELDPVVQAAGAASFNDLLARFGKDHASLAAGVRRQRYRNLRELARLGYGDLPSSLIHGDFQRENLLFAGGQLSGLLDFDSARLDAPVVDLAFSVWFDCLDPGGDRIDTGAASALLDGYLVGRPLTREQLRMVPALIRAHMLWLVAFRLMEWGWPAEGAEGSPRTVASIARTVNRRFPALDAVTPGLERALAKAGGS